MCRLRRLLPVFWVVLSSALLCGCLQQATPAPSAVPEIFPTSSPEAAAPLRAVWVSYLEWQGMDFSSADAFSRQADTLMDNCAALGLNTVIAQVRPFADALYPSRLFPFTHLCTGTQGQDPGFDPLAILIAAAHARGLALHAWVNPYRISTGSTPAALAVDNPRHLHPEWVKEAAGGLYLNPASAAARQFIADGAAELCDHYAIDGLWFDDYFYPTTDPAFDAAEFAACAASLGTASLEDWRRSNVNELVCLVYRTVHARRDIPFGIAPLGSRQSCYAGQYSDAALWLSTPGYVDILMPQLYWGLDYRRGDDRAAALDVLAADWCAQPRAEGVRLAFALAACRIGVGDGGDPSEEWQSGRALAGQLDFLAQQGVEDFSLYRYASLFSPDAFSELTRQERESLSLLLLK